MIVLGFDPGTIRAGWGVVDANTAKPVFVGAGTIHAPEKKPLEERLVLIYDGLVEVMEAHRPAVMALEEVYVGKHANAALALGHARGVAMLAATQRGMPIFHYAAPLVKRAIVGRGAADKEQVGRVVAAMLGMREIPGPDATDALGLAITHAATIRLRALGAMPKRG